MVKKKPQSRFLPLGVAALLTIGGGAAYWLLTQRNTTGIIPVGAEILPQSALISISVSTNPSQWRTLQKYGTSETQRIFQQSLTDLQTRYLTQNGYSYGEDIQPWIGDGATVAFLPLTGQSSILAGQRATVCILPIANLDRARQTLEKVKGSQTGNFSERTYQGVRIQEIGRTQKYWATVLDQRLVITSTFQAINQVIDTYQGGASLATTPGYRTALNEIKANQPFAQLYINLPALAATAIVNSGRQLSPEASAKIKQTQGLGSTILLEPQGIRFKSISWLKPNSHVKQLGENAARNLSQQLPANTLMMASGSDFEQFWQAYSQGSESQLVVPFNPEQFQASVESATGMDFEKDFAKWMDGEFALALLPAQGEPQGAGLVLMAQTSDRRAAERAFNQLDQVMGKKFNLKISTAKVGNQTLTTWKIPPGLPVATHGWLANNTAFLTVGAPVEGAIVPQPKVTLASAELFQTATRSELNPPGGYFFIDLTRAQTLLDSSPLLPKLAPSTRKFATAIRAIGVTAAVKNQRSTRYDVLVNLQKAGSQAVSSKILP